MVSIRVVVCLVTGLLVCCMKATAGSSCFRRPLSSTIKIGLFHTYGMVFTTTSRTGVAGYTCIIIAKGCVPESVNGWMACALRTLGVLGVLDVPVLLLPTLRALGVLGVFTVLGMPEVAILGVSCSPSFQMTSVVSTTFAKVHGVFMEE